MSFRPEASRSEAAMEKPAFDSHSFLSSPQRAAPFITASHEARAQRALIPLVQDVHLQKPGTLGVSSLVIMPIKNLRLLAFATLIVLTAPLSAQQADR